MSRGPPLRCKGLEPDGSDEVWSADVIPKDLDEEVDEGVGGWGDGKILEDLEVENGSSDFGWISPA